MIRCRWPFAVHQLTAFVGLIGKTFTMAGTKDAPGLKPRFVNEIFDIIRRTSKQYEYSVRAYMLEVCLCGFSNRHCY